MNRLLGIVVLVFWLAVPSPPGQAATGPWQGDGHFRARLVSSTTAVGDAAHIDAGLEFDLEPGWKVYWRSPGDAGLPPELDFSSSGAVAGHRLSFPAPERFSILGLDSYGYAGGVILPLRLDLARGAYGDLVVEGRLEGLVCEEICIPVEETLTLSLPAGEGSPSGHARRMAEFKSRVPSAGTAAGVGIDAASIEGGDLVLAFSRDGTPLVRFDGDIFVEAPSGYGFAAPEFVAGLARVKVTGGEASRLAGSPILVTAVGRDFMLEQEVVPGAGALARDGLMAGLLAMLGIAFLGGVILNAMPCVLPVLSLKLSSVLGHGGAARSAIRRSFVATACGVLASFLAIGLGLLAARSAGAAVGWGIQFQQPAFLAFAAAAIATFGLAMLGWFHIPVPAFIQRIAPVGGGGLWGDFASGALATLLATPCSAPFVGTAVAFALAAPGGALVTVFLAMGAGLALPWLLVASNPRMVGLLPRPGPWLVRLRQVLALGLFGTSVWLLTVLAGHFGITDRDGGKWQRWEPGLARSLAAGGRVVFVDVTADWCITCKANKALVIDTGAMAARFEEGGVVLLRADWTHPDESISAYLAEFGRYGIPFNAVYGPAAPAGIALPEVLTAGAVVDALGRAR